MFNASFDLGDDRFASLGLSTSSRASSPDSPYMPGPELHSGAVAGFGYPARAGACSRMWREIPRAGFFLAFHPCLVQGKAVRRGFSVPSVAFKQPLQTGFLETCAHAGVARSMRVRINPAPPSPPAAPPPADPRVPRYAVSFGNRVISTPSPPASCRRYTDSHPRRCTVPRDPGPDDLRFQIGRANRHGLRHLGAHGFMGGGIVGPAGAAALVGVGDVGGRG